MRDNDDGMDIIGSELQRRRTRGVMLRGIHMYVDCACGSILVKDLLLTMMGERREKRQERRDRHARVMHTHTHTQHNHTHTHDNRIVIVIGSQS